MAILGKLLKKGIRLREMLEQEYTSSIDLQKNELKELLITASQTEFGKYHNFADILNGFRKGDKEFYKRFRTNIPIHTYNRIYTDWWKMALQRCKECLLARACQIFCIKFWNLRSLLEIYTCHEGNDESHPKDKYSSDSDAVKV